MSKFSKYATKPILTEAVLSKAQKDFRVTNFMGGNSYELTPINALKIVASSSIFGEPSYYRKSHDGATFRNLRTLEKYSIFASLYKDAKSTTDVFTEVIDRALDYDFKATLDLALQLRKEFYMRMNPSVIFIRASVHDNRVAFNEANPGYMKEIGIQLNIRPDDIKNQFDYWMFMFGSKSGLPSVVKRAWAKSLSGYSRYQMKKYKSKGLIDLVRLSHANSEIIDELMETGNVMVKAEETTWEQLRSSGMKWREILATTYVPHMALLRNLRGIFSEITDTSARVEILNSLKEGVLKGKQFPFRYFSAYNAIQSSEVINKGKILDALEECTDIAVSNMPKLKGKTAVLSDNSGSAWGSIPSQYGSVTIAEIANLSGLITCRNSEEGEMKVFGDRISDVDFSERNGLLSQMKEANRKGKSCGQATENGIWLFFDKAIREGIHYDNIFIYSDQQAFHGGLFGTDAKDYRDYQYNGSRMIDVPKLLETYRKKVNPKVNFFTIQVAGYNNAVVPEDLYRGAVLGGWTGKETVFAKSVIDIWDSIEIPKQ
jgi:hypothetical protein